MKGMKERILKKLRSIPKLGEPKQMPRILHVHASDGWASPPPSVTPLGPRFHHEASPRPSNNSPGRALRELAVRGGKEQQFQDQQQQQGRCIPTPCPKAAGLCKTPPLLPEPDIIDVAELMRDLEEDDDDDDGDDDDEMSDKENTRPAPIVPWAAAATKDRTPPPPGKRRPPLCASSPSSHSGGRGLPCHGCAPTASKDLDESPFRRPDPNSASLFDPDLLAAFEQAVMDHIRSNEEFHSNKARSTPADGEEEEEQKEKKQHKREEGGAVIDQEQPPSMVAGNQTAADNSGEQEGDGGIWRGFELRCPPGGEDAVVLYTTTLRGIRKTFEDCGSVRFLLGGLRVRFCERDVSMHLGYREELWRVLGERATPPRLFVRGRYIGGADEVLGLHERGRLLPLLQGLAADRPGGAPCRGCGGAGFVVCGKCSGSRKMVGVGSGAAATSRCACCNENGLVVCALCSFWPWAPPSCCCSSPVVGKV